MDFISKNYKNNSIYNLLLIIRLISYLIFYQTKALNQKQFIYLKIRK